LEGDRRRLAGGLAGREHADPVAAEVIAEQLGREDRQVGELVRLGGQSGKRPGRVRERVVLLDQVDEPVALERREGAVRRVRRPGRGGGQGGAGGRGGRRAGGACDG